MFAAIQGYGYVRRMTTDVELVRLLDDLLDLLGPADSALRASTLGRRAALVQNIAVVPRAADFRMADEAVAMARRTGRPEALVSPLHSDYYSRRKPLMCGRCSVMRRRSSQPLSMPSRRQGITPLRGVC